MNNLNGLNLMEILKISLRYFSKRKPVRVQYTPTHLLIFMKNVQDLSKLIVSTPPRLMTSPLVLHGFARCAVTRYCSSNQLRCGTC